MLSCIFHEHYYAQLFFMPLAACHSNQVSNNAFIVYYTITTLQYSKTAFENVMGKSKRCFYPAFLVQEFSFAPSIFSNLSKANPSNSATLNLSCEFWGFFIYLSKIFLFGKELTLYSIDSHFDASTTDSF